MSDFQTAVGTATAVATKRVPLAKPSSRVTHQQCLVVSRDKERAGFLRRAANTQGWQTIVAADARHAAEQAIRNRIQLALVDLESIPRPDQEAYRSFVEQLASQKNNGVLLVVCAAEEDVTCEIWSRQLGVWMYLPGVNQESDIAMLCGEARTAIDNKRDLVAPMAG